MDSLSATEALDIAPLARLSQLPLRKEFVNSYEIAPFTCIRRRGLFETRGLLQGIVNSGWIDASSGIYVVELESNPLSPDAGDPLWTPKMPYNYGCVDGWYRLQGIIELF
jgi:hypothetical protein